MWYCLHHIYYRNKIYNRGVYIKYIFLNIVIKFLLEIFIESRIRTKISQYYSLTKKRLANLRQRALTIPSAIEHCH